LLDEAKSIKGFNFSKIDVIGVDTKLSKDLSFLNRHKNFYHLKEQKEPKLQTKKATEVFEIDLEGFEDWREKLFGEIYLNQEGKTCWKKSAFVEIIEGGNSSFNVQNCSNRELLELEIQRAKARGYFDYHGYKIPLTENFLMNIGSKDFDFSQFSNQHFLFENRTINKVPTPKCKIINSQIFDSLLAKKTITEDGRYFEEKGLIANAKNSQLSIFITSQLSEAQNYVLLNEAKKHNVRLSIYLAPNVKMPEGLKTKDTPQGDIRNVILCKDSRLIIDDVANGKIAQGLKEDDLIIVNAKDLVFANLINYTSFKEEAGVFKNFKIVESELFKALKEGKTVILEGHCRKSPKQLNFKNLQLS
jgi:hypothetical protein